MIKLWRWLVLTTLWWSMPVAAQSEYGATARGSAESPAGDRVLNGAAGQLPGSLGEPARAVLDLPGVARASFAGDQLILWGALPSESKFYVDGVEIPSLFHPAGLRTTIHPALLRSVTLTPGAPSAAYGRALGGLIELSTDVARREGLHGELRADAIDSSVAVHGATDKVSASAAARYGYVDRVITRVWPEADQVYPVPSHRDAGGKLVIRLDHTTTLSGTWLYAQDTTHVQRSLDDIAQQTRRSNTFNLVSLSLRRRYTDGARSTLTPFVVIRDQSEDSRYGAVPLSLDQHTLSGGLRGEYLRTRGLLQARLGFDGRAERADVSRFGTLTLPAREGDIRVFGQVPVDAVARDQFRVLTVNLAPHGTLTLRVKHVEVDAGLRLETYLSSVNRSLPRTPGVPAVGTERVDILPEPRVGVSYRALDTLRLEARASLLHQPASPADRSSVFGTPGLRPAQAAHVVLGARASLPFSLQLEALGFYKHLSHLTVRTNASTPYLAQALESDGHGMTAGGSLSLARVVSSGMLLQASYTLSRSLRSDPSGNLRSFDFDQPHVFAMMLGYASEVWQASARLRSASGNPRTSVIGSYVDSTTQSTQPLFARHNRARNPSFFQIDVHVERTFVLGEGSVAPFLDLINLTNHTNVEQVAYTPDYTQRRDVRGLPFLFQLGIRAEF